MPIFTYILILLICILLSNVISRFLPYLSIPIIQIVMGAIIVIINPMFNIELDPHTFLLMFIAPLLFYDGKRVDKRSLWKERKNILLMALALVFATVFIVGILINWLVPPISLAAAFALAAALSPTDYVAVSALSKKIDLPNKVVHIIEGEGLMNDASGIVCFKFALTAVLTGTFSIFNATENFFLVAIGGVIVGLILEMFLIYFEKWINSLGMEDLTVEVLLQILTPFVVYLISEEVFKVSGVLAVVAAGMVYSVSIKKPKINNARLKEVSENTWSVLVYILNGFVFMIVGLQLPNIIKTAYLEATINTPVAILYILIISFVLLFLRFIWVLFMYSIGDKSSEGSIKVNWFDALLTSLSGVRGSVTLATILSIPLTLNNGNPFPNRDLILFLAVGVMLVTLLIATFILPLLAKKDTSEEYDYSEKLKKAQIRVWRETIETLKSKESDNPYVGMAIAEYKYQISQIERGNTYYKSWEIRSKEEKKLLIKCFKKEIENTHRLLEENEIDEDVAFDCEGILENKIRIESLATAASIGFKRLSRMLMLYKRRKKVTTFEEKTRMIAIQDTHAINADYIIEYLKNNINEENEKTYNKVIEYYKGIKLMSRRPIIRRVDKDEKKKIEVISLQIERHTIQSLFERGIINWNIASELRKNLNYIESDTLS
ncbi:Na+/H+ antiporter [Metaclostridioides mangenotii]|uniref:Na+/H+ antiporter n=1 Tax=Metaclostridioides mangenotii TaxID=1540 RepID=UPI0004631D59|nr:Na+/H+ antiporter [Clostridioides mangenotii]